MRRIQSLAVAITGATFLLIAVGGLVRATGSGDACPDWPTCFGRLLPPLEHHTLIEYSHRLLAVLVGALGLGLLWIAVARFRRVGQVLWPVVAAAVLFAIQAPLGGVVVLGSLRPWLVTAHLAAAMLLFGALVHLTANLFCLVKLPAKGPAIRGSDPGFARLALATAGATFVLLLVGAYARGEGGVIEGLGWPLVNGRLVPALEGIATAHFLHRLAAAVVGVLLVVLVARAWTMPRERRSLDLVLLSTAAAGLFVLQAMVGAAAVWTGRAPWSVVAHVALSALIWGSLVALATVSRRLSGPRPVETRAAAAEATAPAAEAVEPATAGRTSGGAVASYVQLTKPRIVLLLLITTVPAMVLAAGTVPSLGLVGLTLLGGTLAAGGANAINQYYDRDIDRLMGRTRSRPLPSHRIAPENALTFGLFLGGVAFYLLATTVNVLSAALALGALVFYVLVYTVWLKRSTPQNIVIGGAAGAVPVLVGWAAVTGTVGAAAWVLFLIVFLWTPPHFWALSLRHAKEYAAAGVPMLPVVRGEAQTVRSILRYSLVLVGATLLLWPVAGMGAVYVAAAAALGAGFVRHAVRLRRRATPALAMGLFRFSISYLALLFAAVALDRLVRIPITG
jgi:protoheme IX farnesyltransferase